MSALKNMAIESTTRKRARQLIQILEDHPETNPLDTLKAFIKSAEYLSGGQKIIEDGDYKSPYELFLIIVMMMVREELSYDPTIGSRQDAGLIKQVVDEEINKWRNKNINGGASPTTDKTSNYHPWYAGMGAIFIIILLRHCNG